MIGWAFGTRKTNRRHCSDVPPRIARKRAPTSANAVVVIPDLISIFPFPGLFDPSENATSRPRDFTQWCKKTESISHLKYISILCNHNQATIWERIFCLPCQP